MRNEIHTISMMTMGRDRDGDAFEVDARRRKIELSAYPVAGDLDNVEDND